jgi:hypothetical protein
VKYPEAAEALTREQAIERLCKVVAEVWEHFDPSASEASDCFCDKAFPVYVRNYRNAGQAVAWVEGVIRAALKAPDGETHPARVRWYEAGRLAGVAEGLEQAITFLEERGRYVEDLREFAGEAKP